MTPTDRHAFLIMAHEQPQLLQRLVDRLDDERTDIYLHVDSEAPFDGSEISTRRSRLLMVEPRVDVRWGHTSQIEAEYALLEASADGDYSYRHIISGTHWPLRPVGEILDWFDAQEGRTVLPEGEWTDGEIRQSSATTTSALVCCGAATALRPARDICGTRSRWRCSADGCAATTAISTASTPSGCR